MNLRAAKEGWEKEDSFTQSAQDTIKSIGKKTYYNDYYTPVFNAILEGDFSSATQLRSQWDNLAKAQRVEQLDDEEAAKRMKAIADAKEQEIHLNVEKRN